MFNVRQWMQHYRAREKEKRKLNYIINWHDISCIGVFHIWSGDFVSTKWIGLQLIHYFIAYPTISHVFSLIVLHFLDYCFSKGKKMLSPHSNRFNSMRLDSRVDEVKSSYCHSPHPFRTGPETVKYLWCCHCFLRNWMFKFYRNSSILHNRV